MHVNLSKYILQHLKAASLYTLDEINTSDFITVQHTLTMSYSIDM